MLILAILMLSQASAYSGADFTHMSGSNDNAMAYIEDAPYFKSNDHAKEYATNLKWNERILQELIRRRDDIWKGESHDLSNGWMLPGQKIDGNMYRDQWYRINIAISIIENYKRKGERDPSDVGSSFVASSIPWKGKL